MRSLLGRFHRPLARSTEEQLLLLNNLGDGSTLSLDFTTGVLDPRITFSRDSNATFINSSGLVQNADANMFRNTTWLTTSLPSQWSHGVGTGTFTYHGDGSITMSAGTSERPFINPSSGYVVTNAGLTYTVGFTVVSATNATVANCITGNSGAELYYINGVNRAGGTALAANDHVQCVFTASGATVTPRLGPGVGGAVSNMSLRITNPQINIGSTVTVSPRYFPNSSTSSGYQAPRFDYDPTSIGTPRGLLIEGSATNICTYSGDMTQSGAGHWSVRTALVTTSWTGFTAPDGTASAVKIIPDTTSSRHTLESSSTTITSGLVYTASVFLKASGYSVASLVIAGGQTRRNFTLSGNGTVESQFGISNTATITPVGSDGWYRVTMTWTANATGGAGLWIGVPQNATTDVVSAWTGNGTSAIQAWGAQLELGSGASSYIPTGASQGQRANESCTIGVDPGTATNFSSWWPLNLDTWTVYWQGDVVRNTTANQFLWLTRDSANVSRMRVFASSTSGQPISGFAGNTVPPAVSVNATAGSVLKTALANAEGDQAFYANNGTVASSGTATNLSVPVNSASMNFNPNSDQFMHIKLLKFWPTRLPNAQLQSLTT